jgi:hypothetical protein
VPVLGFPDHVGVPGTGSGKRELTFFFELLWRHDSRVELLQLCCKTVFFVCLLPFNATLHVSVRTRRETLLVPCVTIPYFRTTAVASMGFTGAIISKGKTGDSVGEIRRAPKSPFELRI